MQRTPSVSAGIMQHLGAVSVAVTLALALIAGVAGCGSDASDAAGDPAALYAANCAACHGEDLHGTATGPSLLSIVYEPSHLSDEAFRTAITSGVKQNRWEFGPMPMQPALSAAQVAAILAYVRAAQQREGFEPYPPAP